MKHSTAKKKLTKAAENPTATELWEAVVSIPDTDIKSEVLVNVLLSELGVDPMDISLLFEGIFHRRYRRDVMGMSHDVHDPDTLNISLSRDSFYHVLPEGVSHTYRSEDDPIDPVTAYKNRLQEEAAAKRFFRPIDNEFFRSRQLIEELESDFFRHASTYGVADTIRQLLDIDKAIPDRLVVDIFILVTQKRALVSNDVGRLGKTLSAILNEAVRIEEESCTIEVPSSDKHNIFADKLGVGLTLDSNQPFFLKKFHFIIGPLKNTDDWHQYYFGGHMEVFLETFFNFFLPYYAQYAYRVELPKEKARFCLDDSFSRARLGMSSVI